MYFCIFNDQFKNSTTYGQCYFTSHACFSSQSFLTRKENLACLFTSFVSNYNFEYVQFYFGNTSRNSKPHKRLYLYVYL